MRPTSRAVRKLRRAALAAMSPEERRATLDRERKERAEALHLARKATAALSPDGKAMLCAGCRRFRPLEAFAPDLTTPSGFARTCDDCARAACRSN